MGQSPLFSLPRQLSISSDLQAIQCHSKGDQVHFFLLTNGYNINALERLNQNSKKKMESTRSGFLRFSGSRPSSHTNIDRADRCRPSRSRSLLSPALFDHQKYILQFFKSGCAFVITFHNICKGYKWLFIVCKKQWVVSFLFFLFIYFQLIMEFK